MKKVIMGVALLTSAITLSGCSDDAQIASRNLSKAADNFEINRRIVFINGITNDYMLTVEGRCSVENNNRRLAVTCKDPAGYKKHYLGLSDNVTYISEQLESKDVSTVYSRITFKPQTIIPDVDFRGESELPRNQ